MLHFMKEVTEFSVGFLTLAVYRLNEIKSVAAHFMSLSLWMLTSCLWGRVQYETTNRRQTCFEHFWAICITVDVTYHHFTTQTVVVPSNQNLSLHCGHPVVNRNSEVARSVWNFSPGLVRRSSFSHHISIFWKTLLTCVCNRLKQ